MCALCQRDSQALIQHSGKLLPGFRIGIGCHNKSSLTPIPAFNAAWSKPLLSGFHLSFGFCNLTFPTPPAATAASPSLPKRGIEGEFAIRRLRVGTRTAKGNNQETRNNNQNR